MEQILERSEADVWNRKDRNAIQTVEWIQQVLKEKGIPTHVVSETSYHDLWFSNRVELEGFSSVGTNGKGVTKEYALASGYGEFMERLQSGFMLGFLYPNKKIVDAKASKQIKTYIKEHEILEQYFGHLIQEETQKEEFIDRLSSMTEMDSYYDLWKHKKVTLPTYLIDYLCGSNGFCAGNTYEEAFAQGMSEVFERYVQKIIYQCNYEEGLFCEVEESVYCNLKSYAMIKAIEAKNYKVHVIDCTLKGKAPVLGVLITDVHNTKYAFRMGADIDLDICLQRCITEIFQGLNFDIYFGYQMRDIFRLEESGDFLAQGDLRMNYIKACVDGNGYLPRKFLNAIFHKVNRLTIYETATAKNNLDAAKQLLELAKDTFDTILIRDLGMLGFPTMRIYVPEHSETFYYQKEDITKVWKEIETVRSYMKQGEINREDVLECVQSIMNYQSYCYGYSMRKLFGIVLKNRPDLDYMSNAYLFLTYLAIYLDKKEVAYENIHKSGAYLGKSKLERELDEVLVEAIMKGVSKEEYLTYIKPFEPSEAYLKRVERFYEIRKHGLHVYCEDCTKCSYCEECLYPLYTKIVDILKMNSCEECEEYVRLIQEIEIWNKKWMM
ncbi:MAG TPA: YcaO-like family protein [Mobilitalea sp.]|nr:YcaO-like family protein [Mobilitalea sp.]